MCHGDRCALAVAVPAAHPSTNMYAPGGPTVSAWHTSAASMAITVMVTSPSQGIAAAQSPRATPAARNTATPARYPARLR